MSGHRDLDLYAATGGIDWRALARGAARVVGILAGLAAALSGVALHALRCFDTCPTDPAQDAALQLLSGSMVAFGLALVVGAASVGTRGSAAGLRIVSVLGALVAVAAAAAIALVPAIDAPGDHSSSMVAGVVALLVGGITAAGAHALSRRSTGAPSPTRPS